MLFLLSKIVFYAVKKLKGKLVFRKIEIIHVRHIVSSVAQKAKFNGLQQFKLQVGNAFQSVLSKKKTELQALRYFGYSKIKIRATSVP